MGHAELASPGVRAASARPQKAQGHAVKHELLLQLCGDGDGAQAAVAGSSAAFSSAATGSWAIACAAFRGAGTWWPNPQVTIGRIMAHKASQKLISPGVSTYGSHSGSTAAAVAVAVASAWGLSAALPAATGASAWGSSAALPASAGRTSAEGGAAEAAAA